MNINENMTAYGNTNDNKDDEVRKNLKMRKWDTGVTLLFAAALIVLYFFWGCSLDWIVSVCAVLIAAIASFIGQKKKKKIKELSGNLRESE